MLHRIRGEACSFSYTLLTSRQQLLERRPSADRPMSFVKDLSGMLPQLQDVRQLERHLHFPQLSGGAGVRGDPDIHGVVSGRQLFQAEVDEPLLQLRLPPQVLRVPSLRDGAELPHALKGVHPPRSHQLAPFREVLLAVPAAGQAGTKGGAALHVAIPRRYQVLVDGLSWPRSEQLVLALELLRVREQLVHALNLVSVQRDLDRLHLHIRVLQRRPLLPCCLAEAIGHDVRADPCGVDHVLVEVQPLSEARPVQILSSPVIRREDGQDLLHHTCRKGLSDVQAHEALSDLLASHRHSIKDGLLADVPIRRDAPRFHGLAEERVAPSHVGVLPIACGSSSDAHRLGLVVRGRDAHETDLESAGEGSGLCQRVFVSDVDAGDGNL
mmetsp:Transcript_65270/g.187772  ORF Transcript_65270/g.187772 Transcript_65270/m.187772 type:complete len:383 (-) Transcript_65270:240-1388(-)